jgi:hypothetical protein
MMHPHKIAGQELSRAKDMPLLLGRPTAEEKTATFLTGPQERDVRIGRSAITLGTHGSSRPRRPPGPDHRDGKPDPS